MHTAQAEVGVCTESTMPSALGQRRSASEWHIPPPTLATVGGVLLTIFPHFFKERVNGRAREVETRAAQL